MKSLSRNLFFWAAVVAAAVVGASLISDSDDSWAEFVAWALFFSSINLPLLFAPYGNRPCTAWLARGHKKD